MELLAKQFNRVNVLSRRHSDKNRKWRRNCRFFVKWRRLAAPGGKQYRQLSPSYQYCTSRSDGATRKTILKSALEFLCFRRRRRSASTQQPKQNRPHHSIYIVVAHVSQQLLSRFVFCKGQGRTIKNMTSKNVSAKRASSQENSSGLYHAFCGVKSTWQLQNFRRRFFQEG
jgi:hypothetical protein